MTSDLIQLLACPIDRASPLSLTTVTRQCPDRIETGTLCCPKCGQKYPIEDGIPRLLPQAQSLPAEEAREKDRERRQRDLEARIYDRNRALRLFSFAEIPATLGWLKPTRADTLLEVGCGTGRFTRYLASRCGRVIAVDHSLASLQIARARTSGYEVDFLQADASYLPLVDGIATKALSGGMLQHLPTNAARERALAGIARSVRPGDQFVVSVYWYSPFARCLGDREGHHSGEIYYYRFARGEFRALLEPCFQVESLTGALCYLLLARGSRRAHVTTA